MLNEGLRQHPGQDLTSDDDAWALSLLYDAAEIEPPGDREWAALMLITLTVRDFYASEDVIWQIVHRCYIWDLPEMERSW